MTEWVDPALQVAYRSLGLSLSLIEESIDDLHGTEHRGIMTRLANVSDVIVRIRDDVEDILMDMEVVP